MAMEYIRFGIGALFLLMGLVVFFLEIFGVFRFKYVMNRMHAAAMGDTMGLACCMTGLIVISGINVNSAKLLMFVLFLWCSSPVASHLIARMELHTNEDKVRDYETKDLSEVEAEMASREEQKEGEE